MSSEPKQNWDDLRLSGRGDGNLEIPSKSTGVETGYGPARYALGQSGEPRLLVPCRAAGLEREFKSTDKLSIRVARFRIRGSDQYFIDLVCHDPSLDAVFSELAGEVLVRLANGEGPEKAVSGTVDDFRALLLADAATNVSRQIVIGLLGELYVLCMMAKHRPSSGQSWMGPWEQRHDFRRLDRALEVKTSSRSDATSVSIHGIDQLQAPDGGQLVLMHIRMEPSSAGRIYLEALFDELIMAGIERKRLIDGLAVLGCLNPYDEDWNRHRFEIQGESAWQVIAGFPRLTTSEMIGGSAPGGVSDLSYRIDLSAAGDFLISPSELDCYLIKMLS